MAQIRPITSEAIEATIRNLLPSQSGFGEDMQAQNVIVPVLDITPTAEGSQLRPDLASAINFTDATVFNVANTTTTVANTPGFWRVVGTANVDPNSATNAFAKIQLTDGLSTKDVWQLIFDTGTDVNFGVTFDLIFWLNTGDSIVMNANVLARITGSVRQIADRYGNIKNPTGFTFE